MSFFFDTNVLVYVFDRTDPAKRARAQDLVTRHMAARDMVLSTQVLQELYVTLTRKKHLGPVDALEVVTTFAQERIVPASADLVLRGFALCQERQVSPWDGLILQAALQAGCTTLYSEDFQTGAVFGELSIVNPFAPETSAEKLPKTARKRL
ncbi:PIN domain-containing protein [soil metagenome]